MVKPSGNTLKLNPIKELPALDRSRPYSEMCGLPGVAFEQSGFYFNHDGNHVLETQCQPVNDEKDAPLSEEYTGYNQVTLVETPSVSVRLPSDSIAIIYGRD